MAFLRIPRWRVNKKAPPVWHKGWSVRTDEPLEIFAYACDTGAPIQGSRLGPMALKKAGLESALNARGLASHWTVISLNYTPPPSTSAIPVIQEVTKTLSHHIVDTVTQAANFIVLGGDHSSAIGSWSGAAQALRPAGPLGLIWIDAHMDSHTPATSPTGAIHGMPLACLLGYGNAALTDLLYRGPKLQPQHVCLVGVHSFEAAEAQLLHQLGVRVFFMEEVKMRGLSAVLSDALAIVTNHTAGFGISLDLDVFDPKAAPGVSTPAPGGLSSDEFVETIGLLTDRQGFIGMEIAEYNPTLDRHRMTADLVKRLLLAGFGSRTETFHASFNRPGKPLLRQ